MIVTTSLARRCPNCKKWVIVSVHEIEVKSQDELENMDFPNLSLQELVCCGQSEPPTHMVLSDDLGKAPHFIPLGTDELPVTGHNISTEESERLDRGAEIQLRIWRDQQAQILEDYYDWVIQEGLWSKIIDEMSPKEFKDAFEHFGLSNREKPSHSQSVSIIRKFSVDEQKQFFLSISSTMIEEMVWYMHWAEWPVARWRNTYGKNRIIWPIVHMPLAEDLEPQRISAIAKLSGNKRPETTLLFERIRSLEANLHRRNEQMRKQAELLAEARAQKSAVEEKLTAAYKDNRKLREEIFALRQSKEEVHSKPNRKIDDLKGIIAEMREELKKLRPAEEILPAILEEDNGKELEEPQYNDDLSLYKIAIIGGRREGHTGNYPNILTISNDKEPSFERVLADSDILVVLTQHVSHSTMWTAKEFAIEHEKAIVYSRHISVPLILKQISETL